MYKHRRNMKMRMKMKNKYNNRKRKRKRSHNSDSDDESEYESETELISQKDLDRLVYRVDNDIYFNTDVSPITIDHLICIINDINNDYKKISKNKLIKRATPNPIVLHITSDGGCLFSGLKAINAIKRSSVPIYTVIDGLVASAATLIAIVGKKRFITPESYALLHQLSSGIYGKFGDIKDEHDNCEILMKRMVEIYAEHSKMNIDEIEKCLKNELIWNYETCIDNGIVDGVYTNSKI